MQEISGQNLKQLDSLVAVLEKRIEFTEKEESKNYKDNYKKSFKNNNYKTQNSSYYNNEYNEKKKDFRTKYASRSKPKLQPFDINKADTSQLKRIYGIGNVLSARIVKYRDILGGFSNKEQFKEIYGLKDETLKKLDSLTFISSDFKPNQVELNKLEAYKLDDHPYISKKVAKAIDAYRFQHGKIDSLEVLYNIQIIDSATLEKIAPYLKF